MEDCSGSMPTEMLKALPLKGNLDFGLVFYNSRFSLAVTMRSHMGSQQMFDVLRKPLSIRVSRTLDLNKTHKVASFRHFVLTTGNEVILHVI